MQKTYLEWMENIHDWCISRQLWWGHRIPAWHCGTCQQDHRGQRETPTACAHCGQTEDHAGNRRARHVVLLGPAARAPSSAGRVHRTSRRFRRLLSHQLLVTGFDILFFWVARMIMLGCHFAARCAHARRLERDAHGRRALPRGLHSRPGARRQPREDVEDQGQRHRPHRDRQASTAPTPSASRWPRWPRRAPTSPSTRRAPKAIAPSPTRSGTPRASSS